MEAPTIILEGKEYAARKLKMKAWRQVVKLQKEIGNMSQVEAMNDEESMEKIAHVLETIFNNPEVTAERILEEMDLKDFVPVAQKAAAWVQLQVSGKMDEIPKNSQTTVRR